MALRVTQVRSVFVCLNQKQHTCFGSAFLKMFVYLAPEIRDFSL